MDTDVEPLPDGQSERDDNVPTWAELIEDFNNEGTSGHGEMIYLSSCYQAECVWKAYHLLGLRGKKSKRGTADTFGDFCKQCIINGRGISYETGMRMVSFHDMRGEIRDHVDTERKRIGESFVYPTWKALYTKFKPKVQPKPREAMADRLAKAQQERDYYVEIGVRHYDFIVSETIRLFEIHRRNVDWNLIDDDGLDCGRTSLNLYYEGIADPVGVMNAVFDGWSITFDPYDETHSGTWDMLAAILDDHRADMEARKSGPEPATGADIGAAPDGAQGKPEAPGEAAQAGDAGVKISSGRIGAWGAFVPEKPEAKSKRGRKAAAK